MGRGVETLTGEYLPTEKNRLVKDLLPNLGFIRTGQDTYALDLDDKSRLPTKINRGEQDDR
jgi:predicted enzyme involved in methoxymalonyl-ACP biosynthesis